ncbi:MAG: NUDIX hydrolase [Verrucomicrobiales bacterium]|nr:NUDIX hydrolase [Verrucomicrobiales bacterium]
MHREPLLKLLSQYREGHPGEEDRTNQFIDFVERNPECFERSLQEGHITGSAWIVDSSGKNTLLTHHRKLNIWLQPGGHADGNHDVMAVALQEGLEETGLSELEAVTTAILDLDIHGIPARKDEPSHFHYDVRFLLRQCGGNDYVVSEESHDLAWVPMEKLDDYSEEWSMRRMRRKAMEILAGR